MIKITLLFLGCCVYLIGCHDDSSASSSQSRTQQIYGKLTVKGYLETTLNVQSKPQKIDLIPGSLTTIDLSKLTLPQNSQVSIKPFYQNEDQAFKTTDGHPLAYQWDDQTKKLTFTAPRFNVNTRIAPYDHMISEDLYRRDIKKGFKRHLESTLLIRKPVSAARVLRDVKDNKSFDTTHYVDYPIMKIAYPHDEKINLDIMNYHIIISHAGKVISTIKLEAEIHIIEKRNLKIYELTDQKRYLIAIEPDHELFVNPLLQDSATEKKKVKLADSHRIFATVLGANGSTLKLEHNCQFKPTLNANKPVLKNTEPNEIQTLLNQKQNPFKHEHIFTAADVPVLMTNFGTKGDQCSVVVEGEDLKLALIKVHLGETSAKLKQLWETQDKDNPKTPDEIKNTLKNSVLIRSIGSLSSHPQKPNTVHFLLHDKRESSQKFMVHPVGKSICDVKNRTHGFLVEIKSWDNFETCQIYRDDLKDLMDLNP